MKIRMVWKDPDWTELLGWENPASVLERRRSKEEARALEDLAMELGCSEYLTVELDTEARTVRIVGKGDRA